MLARVHFNRPMVRCEVCGHAEPGGENDWWRERCVDAAACLVRCRDLTKRPLDGSDPKGLPRVERYRPTYGISVTT